LEKPDTRERVEEPFLPRFDFPEHAGRRVDIGPAPRIAIPKPR